MELQRAFRNLTITTNGKVISDNLTTTGGGGGVSGMWDAMATGGATSHYVWDSDNPYSTAHSQRISYLQGTGTVRIANRGLK